MKEEKKKMSGQARRVKVEAKERVEGLTVPRKL